MRYDERKEAEAFERGLNIGRLEAAKDLAAAEERGRRRGLKEAAKICEAMVVGGRAWTADQAAAADVLFAAAGQIRMGLAPRDSGKEPGVDPSLNTVLHGRNRK